MRGIRDPFVPGNHLRVRRANLYYHHGVLVGDDRVVEFGGAGWSTKPRASIRFATLEHFEGAGKAELVDHSRPQVSGITLPEPLSRDEIVARAEWLVANAPQGLYSLVGSNCEHVANWCVTGWFESTQARGFFKAWALGVPIGAAVLYKAGRLPWWFSASVGAAGVALPYKYNKDAFRWAETLDRWPGVEGLSDGR